MSAQTTYDKLNSMRDQLHAWPGDIKQVSPYYSYQYVRSFTAQQLSGFIYDHNNHPIIAFVHDHRNSVNLHGVLLACNSVDSYGINLGHGFMEVFVNTTRLGVYRVNQGIFDNAGNCIGNIGLKQRVSGADNHYNHIFSFRSGLKGVLAYLAKTDKNVYYPSGFSGEAIEIQEGRPSDEERHWLIALQIIMTAGMGGAIQNSNIPQKTSGIPFSLKMFFAIMFLIFVMPLINYFVFELILFPDFEGSMGFTKMFFCGLCFLFCGKVFQYILFGSELLGLIFNRQEKIPGNYTELIQMEKSSSMNLVILPSGFLFGLLWGFVMGLFSKQLDTSSTAWIMGAYGLGFSLLLLIMIKLSLISMFAFAKADDL